MGKIEKAIQILVMSTGGRGELSWGDASAMLPDNEGSPQHPAKRVLGTGREACCSPVWLCHSLPMGICHVSAALITTPHLLKD